jgi:hypothetical protein
MKITAKQFNLNPAQAYRAADKGESVVITNSRYPDVEFVLTAENKDECTKAVKGFEND